MADRKTQKLLEGLQGDLERELKAMLQYTYQASMLLGVGSLSISPYLRQEAADELKHVGFLCDQIVGLGGSPKLTSHKICASSKRCWRMISIWSANRSSNIVSGSNKPKPPARWA